MPAEFNWEDPLDLESQLTGDERMIRDSARAFCNDKLAPRVKQAFRDETLWNQIHRDAALEQRAGRRRTDGRDLHASERA